MQPSYRKCQEPLLMIPSNNLHLKLLSLNIRGLRDFVKRKAVVNWINKQNADIIFLQETYSTAEIENGKEICSLAMALITPKACLY